MCSNLSVHIFGALIPLHFPLHADDPASGHFPTPQISAFLTLRNDLPSASTHSRTCRTAMMTYVFLTSSTISKTMVLIDEGVLLSLIQKRDTDSNSAFPSDLVSINGLSQTNSVSVPQWRPRVKWNFSWRTVDTKKTNRLQRNKPD